MRLILCALVVLAWISGPVFGPKSPAISARPAIAPASAATSAIDFEQLRAQARGALDQLRQSQEARLLKLARAE